MPADGHVGTEGTAVGVRSPVLSCPFVLSATGKFVSLLRFSH